MGYGIFSTVNVPLLTGNGFGLTRFCEISPILTSKAKNYSAMFYANKQLEARSWVSNFIITSLNLRFKVLT